MGANGSCCDKSETAVQSTVARQTSAVITKQPSPSDMAFPRYPVLPAIQVKDTKETRLVPKQVMSVGNEACMNLYNQYVDPAAGKITAEGIERLCEDLELSPEDYRVLVLAYGLKAQVMCQLTESEFVSGCERLNVTSISSLKDTIPDLRKAVKGDGFPPFYRWAFKFALEMEAGQRSLPLEIAVSLWRLVFTDNPPVLLDRWLNFLEISKVKGVSRDTWDMFLVFVEQIGEDLVSYDDTEAWPSLLDDFVESELDAHPEEVSSL